MKIDPYSIYYEHRPFRVAFLVDPNDQFGLVDKIVDYNRGRWGGRYNPIIFTDGNTIVDDWWRFLRSYDPDIIYCTKKISDELREKIQIFLTPLTVETIRDEKQPAIHISNDPISILPSRKVIASISNDFFGSESNLVLFELDKSTPDAIKDFVLRNFGTYETGQKVPSHLNKILESCNLKIYKVEDYESLNTALLELGDFKTRSVFPAQVCSETNHVKDTEYDHKLESFEVIVGDTIEDIAYNWNRTLNIRHWLRPRITQLWVPSEMIMEPAIKDGLSKFINRYAGSVGSGDHHQINYVTFSLNAEKIKEIADFFKGTSYYPKTSILYTEPQVPEFSKHSKLFIMKRGLDFVRANSLEEHLVIDEPEVEEAGKGGQHWFTDFSIEYRPERNKTIMGKDYWWQLPRRNAVLSDLQFFNKPARINELGMFSVMMRRKTTFEPDEATVVIKIPSDERIFQGLILGESYKNISTDPRQAFLSRPYYTTGISLMGKYLRGVLSLFPDLDSAYRLFKERYIRTMFERLSNKRSTRDQKLVAETAQELKDKIALGVDLTTDTGLNWLADRTIKISKKIGSSDKSLLFLHFLEEAQQETKEYNRLNPKNQFEVEENEIKEKLTGLIESGILLSGIKINCLRCGDKNWYHINDIRQNVICSGCSYEFIVPAEQRWSYRLNNMIRKAYAEHGTVPVLLVLGQLFADARSSFIFVPCIDLFTKVEGEEQKVKTDLDIACLIDGKFIIGEVKQSVGLFKEKNFTDMAEIAELLKPDRIIFSSLDKKPNKFVKGEIAKLETRLVNLEVEVEWYPVDDYVFEPLPVRW